MMGSDCVRLPAASLIAKIASAGNQDVKDAIITAGDRLANQAPITNMSASKRHQQQSNIVVTSSNSFSAFNLLTTIWQSIGI